MQVSLTDGSNVTYGCVDVTGTGETNSDGCNSNDTRSQSFVFQPGETVTSLTLWAGYSPQQEANQRSGAVSFNTSQVISHCIIWVHLKQEYSACLHDVILPCLAAPCSAVGLLTTSSSQASGW